MQRVVWPDGVVVSAPGFDQDLCVTLDEAVLLRLAWRDVMPRDVRNPSVLVLQRIASALQVDVVDLFDEAKARAFAEQYRR